MFIGRKKVESPPSAAPVFQTGELSTFFLPSRGKEHLLSAPQPLLEFYNNLDFESIRVRRPRKFVFFCGGVFGNDDTKPKSLRQYLLRTRNISSRVRADIVLAEAANQLYRDTEFSDLITFEEEIAIISSLVLVIAESAGSLAELGAFATSDQIRQSMAVLMRTEHFEQNSFVRYGPIEKILREKEGRVGSFPWRSNGHDMLVQSSIRGHVRAITNFINSQVSTKPEEFLFRVSGKFQSFCLILWILHISRAISLMEIENYTTSLGINISRRDIKNKLYCMKIAGWVDTYTYINKTYWYAKTDIDPISRYSYINTAKERDPVRHKLAATTAIQKDLQIPTHVARHVSTVVGAGR
ncbi:retron St85 family effector protein [Rhizobium leguminosarum]|uniref:retron St85 family effector protein n=1 Tax=Rhizobium leguminosarum TaxID=384 RepID=UPI003F9B8BAE